MQLLQYPLQVKHPVQLAQLPVHPLLQPPVQLPLQLVQLDAQLSQPVQLLQETHIFTHLSWQVWQSSQFVQPKHLLQSLQAEQASKILLLL